MNKLQQYFFDKYGEYRSHINKIIFIVAISLVFFFIFNLPYINIIAVPFLFIPYLIGWIFIVGLFRPRKELILKAGLILFILDLPFAWLHLDFILEPLGQASFLFIGTYVLLSLKEIKN